MMNTPNQTAERGKQALPVELGKELERFIATGQIRASIAPFMSGQILIVIPNRPNRPVTNVPIEVLDIMQKNGYKIRQLEHDPRNCGYIDPIFENPNGAIIVTFEKNADIQKRA